jgi:hypothetical protein
MLWLLVLALLLSEPDLLDEDLNANVEDDEGNTLLLDVRDVEDRRLYMLSSSPSPLIPSSDDLEAGVKKQLMKPQT